MERQVHIRRLVLRYRGQAAAERTRLDAVAHGALQRQLDQVLAPLDDGRRIIVIRKLSTHMVLAGGLAETALAKRWAEQIAASVRQVLGGALPPIGDEVAVFDSAIEVLASYVEAALAGGLDHWVWAGHGGALAAALRAGASLPGGDGRTHAFVDAPALPAPRTVAGAIEWALRAAGAAFPALVDELRGRSRASAALHELPAAAAERLLVALEHAPVDVPAAASVRPPVLLELLVRATGAWPAYDRLDPRNRLLVAALAVARRPSFRGSPGLLAQVSQALVESLPAGERAAWTAAPRAELHDPTPMQVRAVVPPAEPGRAAPGSPRASDAPAAVPEAVPEVLAEDVGGASDAAASPRATMTVTSDAGGALFLLALLRELALPDAILDEPTLAAGPGLGALLYGLYARLAPQAWADPMLLALSGLDAPLVPDQPLDAAAEAALARVLERVVAGAAAWPAVVLAGDAEELRGLADELPPSLRASASVDDFYRQLSGHLVAWLRARLGDERPAAALLARLIGRRGELMRSRTHLDFYAALDDVDLDVRRAALDVDPGWVGFLGRVVSIHYL
jgi:hypothetical protein